MKLEAICIGNTIYVALLLVFCVLCLILISRKNVRYKDLPASQESARSALPYGHGHHLFRVHLQNDQGSAFVLQHKEITYN